MPTSLGVVDSHPIFVEGVRALVARDPDLVMVGPTAESSPWEMTLASMPDILVVGAKELTALASILADRCVAAVVNEGTESEVMKALGAGANGVVHGTLLDPAYCGCCTRCQLARRHPTWMLDRSIRRRPERCCVNKDSLGGRPR